MRLVGALGLAALAVPVAAAVIFRPSPGTSSSAAQAVPAASSTAPAATVPATKAPPGFPAPPPGAVVFARQLGSDDLALGLVPRSGSLLAQASLVGPQGTGVAGRPVAFAVQGRTTPAAACGAGCYRATLPVSGRLSSVDVIVGGSPATRWRVALPTAWPAPDAGALVARAEKVWRSLRSVSFTERLGSGTGTIVRSSWQIQAPDRLAYQVKDGWAAVVVGARRWDRSPGSTRWVETPQTRLTQPVPEWVAVRNAHVLGSTTIAGRPAWTVSFFDPGTPGWFQVLLDKQTLRALLVRMTATAHFMRDDFGSFNSTAPIEPPR
ncbi:MAG TPA: hypothetical protein VLW05_06440 [Gaiellaceae bacterium]|nr:hypothetical protein [Gaiellaceae bacterium]